MKGLFCDGRKAKNNEEYRLVLKKRQNGFWGLFAVGLFTIALGAVLNIAIKEQVSSRQISFVLGLGTGLSLASCIEIWLLAKIMKSEEQLKAKRLKEVDEREIEVRSRALQATAKVTLVVLYFLMIIGGLFIEEFVGVCFLVIAVFLLSFQLFQQYYGKKL